MTDHTLTLRHMTSGALRWEPWPDGRRGELCFAGLRHATELDECGCPKLTVNLRTALKFVDRQREAVE